MKDTFWSLLWFSSATPDLNKLITKVLKSDLISVLALHVFYGTLFWEQTSFNIICMDVCLFTVMSSPSGLAAVMGEYEPKIEVQFEETLHVAKGSSVRLECFALGK